MAYLANQLINDAWYLSGIVSNGFNNPEQDDTAQGLFLLNSLLDFASIDTSIIPFFFLQTFDLVVGQEEYEIENLLEVETLTFVTGNVRYPMRSQGRVDYFGSGRVNNITSLPNEYRVERTLTGSKIYIYFIPDAAYVATIYGKFGLTNVTLSTDLSTVYGGAYCLYLRYALAKMMCELKNVEFGAEKLKALSVYEKKLKYVSAPDMSVQKISTLQGNNSFNWAYVNIGKGWVP